MMSSNNIVQAQEDDLKRPRGERIPFKQLHDNSNNVVITNQRYAGAKKNMDHHSYHHQYRHRDEYEYESNDQRNIDEDQELRTKRPNSPKIVGLSQQQQHHHQQKQRGEVNYLSQPPPSPPPPPSYHGPHAYEGDPYGMLRPPLSYMAEFYPPYHQSYPKSHMDIDSETGADTDNAVNKTSTAAVLAQRPSPPPPQQTNYHYCPSLSGNDRSSTNSNGCNYKYDDVIEVSGSNKNNNTNTNTNTNDFNIHQRLLEERKSDSNDNNDSNNAFLSNAMSSNFSSASSGNDSAPAAFKHPSTINDTNKRRKLDSSNKNVTATAYDVTSIIAKKDGTVHNVRPVAVSYTQKRGRGGGGGGGGVLSSSTSTTANHRQKKRKFYTFEDQLAQLADYKEKNGHCIVPRSFQGYGNLGQWVSYQRQEYKKYKGSEPSRMTNERIRALGKLGFRWKIVYTKFDDRLAQLADYKEKNGHCIVPQSFQGYGNLGQWVDRQRQEYKKYKESKPSNMTNERIRALEKLDFKWRICTKYINFEDRLAQLADYKEKNGHCIVPQSFQGYGKLGIWVNSTRMQYKKYKESKPSNMTKERIRALEELDFKWQAKRGHAPGTSLLAQQAKDDNEVVAVAHSVPTLEVPPTEIVVDVEKEDQIERLDDDQLFGDNTMTSSNDGDSDEDIGEDNVYRAEGDDHYYGNSDHDGGGWHDLGDDFHDIDDDSLVF